jgi:hypothetical protein
MTTHTRGKVQVLPSASLEGRRFAQDDNVGIAQGDTVGFAQDDR